MQCAKIYLLNKKLKIFLNYILGPVLFLWLSFSIYQQIQQQRDVRQSWALIKAACNGTQFNMLLLIIGLMLVIWCIEAKKWQYLVSGIQDFSFISALKAVFSGQALGFSTLNGIGVPAGRSLFLEEGNRLKGVVLYMVGSMSQMVVTLVLGICSLIYLRLYLLSSTHQFDGLSVFWIDSLIYLLSAGMIIVIFLYFRLSWFIIIMEKIPFIARYQFLIQELENFHWRELTKILIFSASRYVISLVQYILLFQIFDVNINWMSKAALICVMHLVLSIVPSITLAELGFRGKLSIALFGLLSANTIGIITTVAGIWIINIIIPAAIGSLFLLGIRLFKNK